MSQQPCLPVSRRRKRKDNDDEDQAAIHFDDIQSMDATDYLSRVVTEANRLPENFTCNKSSPSTKRRKTEAAVRGSAASLSYLISDRTLLQPPPTKHHVPASSDWLDRTLETFSRLRGYLEQCRLQGVGGKHTNRLFVPPLKDRSGWLIFCVGLDDAQGNAGSYFDDGDAKTQEEQELPPWRRNLPPKGYIPTVSLMLQMDQVMIRRILSHLVHYIRAGWSPSPCAAWIYALLARLERPIHRDDAVVMYSLLKKLCAVRVSIDTEQKRKDELARVNVLIAIIAVYFEQGNAGVMEFKP